MQLAECGTRRPVCIDCNASVADASRLMREQRADKLVVVAGSDPRQNGARNPAGIISAQDIVTRVIALGLDPAVLTTGDLVWSRPASVHLSDSVPEALERLCQAETEALPVIDSDGRVAGVVSLEDILQVVAGSESSRRHRLRR
jgi:CBS domain-containing protein